MFGQYKDWTWRANWSVSQTLARALNVPARALDFEKMPQHKRWVFENAHQYEHWVFENAHQLRALGFRNVHQYEHWVL